MIEIEYLSATRVFVRFLRLQEKRQSIKPIQRELGTCVSVADFESQAADKPG